MSWGPSGGRRNDRRPAAARWGKPRRVSWRSLAARVVRSIDRSLSGSRFVARSWSAGAGRWTRRPCPGDRYPALEMPVSTYEVPAGTENGWSVGDGANGERSVLADHPKVAGEG